MRKEFDSLRLQQRTDALSAQAATLKYLSETFSIPVIVSNQVTTGVDYSHATDARGTFVAPALGNTWAHSVNTRLIIEYASQSQQSRIIRIAKSPLAAWTQCSVFINSAGITSNGAVQSDESTDNGHIATRSSFCEGTMALKDAQHEMILHQQQDPRHHTM